MFIFFSSPTHKASTSEKPKMSDANYDVWWWCWFWNSNPILRFLLTATCIAMFSIIHMRRKKHEEPLPPGPFGLPLLGYLPFLGSDLHLEFTKLSETYGPIYKLWLGKKLCVVISSPSIAKEVVRDHDLVFANRDATIASLILTDGGSDITFANYGDYWRKTRKIFVQQMMSNTSIDSFSGLRRREVRKSIRGLYGKVGSEVDIGELALHLMISVTMAMVWGRTVGEGRQGESIESEYREVVAELMVVLGQPNVSDLFPFIARFDIQGVGKRAERILQWLNSFLDPIIERAKAERANRTAGKEEEAATTGDKKDILQILLDQQLMDKNIENSTLKAILNDIVIGGTDTTATTTEWVMARVLYHQHQDVMEKVMEELTRVVGTDGMVEERHLPELKYLDAVIKETFRLHPPLPLLIPKASRENTSLYGYNIPKGAKVFLNIWAIQRDPHVWENPEEFRPERFLENPATFDFYGNNSQFMPFGSGRRVCPGISLAERMAKYVLASLLHSFHWELPPGEELEFEGRFGLVLKKLNRLVAIPKPKYLHVKEILAI